MKMNDRFLAVQTSGSRDYPFRVVTRTASAVLAEHYEASSFDEALRCAGRLAAVFATGIAVSEVVP